MKNKELKKKIIEVLKEQGFKVNPHLSPGGYSKNTYRRLQQKAKLEQLFLHRNFLLDSTSKVKNYYRNHNEIILDKIILELREIRTDTFEEILFRWWNLMWWSIPFQRSYGRQMRFFLWDVTHDAPFGLISLQSPVLNLSVRDKALEIPKDELDTWVNRSMNAQRVGALPPYNELLGGKMVALSLTSNEMRKAYKKKYNDYKTIIKGRQLNPDLLFITTTSAFGKSSMYNRLKYDGDLVAKSLGFTKGFGSFHISEELYIDLLKLLSKRGIDIERGYGNGPSRKLRLIGDALSYLGMRSFDTHGIKREFFLFPLVKNLKAVIQRTESPDWYNRPFNNLVTYWKERWAIPRSERKPDWKNSTVGFFFRKTERILKKLEREIK